MAVVLMLTSSFVPMPTAKAIKDGTPIPGSDAKPKEKKKKLARNMKPGDDDTVSEHQCDKQLACSPCPQGLSFCLAVHAV